MERSPVRRILQGNRFRAYPHPARRIRPSDASVVYGGPVYAFNRRAIANPALVFEILSPSTADYDYGGKFELYRGSGITAGIRTGIPNARPHRALPEAIIPFPSFGIEISMPEVYDGKDFNRLPA